ncbi:MAG TPA: TadE family protein [Nocardioidaceae bacterium]|nr:TadE family protein [Nocardioidaceae bacterium]
MCASDVSGRGPTGRRSRRERGTVTAEAAVVLPALIGVTMTLVWVVGAGVAQVRCVDAARDAVRALARDEPEAAVVAAAREMLPPGARVQVSRSGSSVEVRISYAATPPGSWLDGAMAWPIDATASMPSEAGGAADG